VKRKQCAELYRQYKNTIDPEEALEKRLGFYDAGCVSQECWDDRHCAYLRRLSPPGKKNARVSRFCAQAKKNVFFPQDLETLSALSIEQVLELLNRVGDSTPITFQRNIQSVLDAHLNTLKRANGDAMFQIDALKEEMGSLADAQETLRRTRQELKDALRQNAIDEKETVAQFTCLSNDLETYEENIQETQQIIQTIEEVLANVRLYRVFEEVVEEVEENEEPVFVEDIEEEEDSALFSPPPVRMEEKVSEDELLRRELKKVRLETRGAAHRGDVRRMNILMEQAFPRRFESDLINPNKRAQSSSVFCLNTEMANELAVLTTEYIEWLFSDIDMLIILSHISRNYNRAIQAAMLSIIHMIYSLFPIQMDLKILLNIANNPLLVVLILAKVSPQVKQTVLKAGKLDRLADQWPEFRGNTDRVNYCIDRLKIPMYAVYTYGAFFFDTVFADVVRQFVPEFGSGMLPEYATFVNGMAYPDNAQEIAMFLDRQNRRVVQSKQFISYLIRVISAAETCDQVRFYISLTHGYIFVILLAKMMNAKEREQAIHVTVTPFSVLGYGKEFIQGLKTKGSVLPIKRYLETKQAIAPSLPNDDVYQTYRQVLTRFLPQMDTELNNFFDTIGKL
jgi:hypothetical protein